MSSAQHDNQGGYKSDHALLQAVVDAMPEPFFVFDADGYYRDLLGGADRQRYHDGSHLIGKRIHDVMDAALADTFVHEIRRALTRGQPTTFVYQLAATDIQGSEALAGPAGKLWFEAHISPISQTGSPAEHVLWIAFNITQLQATLLEKQRLIDELEAAMKEVKTLRGILPICSYCKNIRNDDGGWASIETYISQHSEANLSHGICPDCSRRHFPDLNPAT